MFDFGLRCFSCSMVYGNVCLKGVSVSSAPQVKSYSLHAEKLVARCALCMAGCMYSRNTDWHQDVASFSGYRSVSLHTATSRSNNDGDYCGHIHIYNVQVDDMMYLSSHAWVMMHVWHKNGVFASLLQCFSRHILFKPFTKALCTDTQAKHPVHHIHA